ncbi:hypothetical protein EDD52_102288 [Primorskyibacter sedentarius]|uniref:Uncharacterized protein n=1 Tax=Primorskyibacter sedentarius TaxID=745311 RepID=A0A4R3JMJ5_9RHOB|nr:hypothetical protein [Primorskyibacter sedentarius]TCS66471.1 hypothetical protein EDD52_102288 [Primorskyibacter sedentarius]
MEILIAVPIVLLCVLGLSAGLMLGGKRLETSCHGMKCLGGIRCDGCPKRRKRQEAASDD